MTMTADTTTMTTNEPAAPTLRAITLPYSPELLGGFYAVALHASKDDVTPVICHVKVDSRYLIATDRYSVGQWEHTPYMAETMTGAPASHDDLHILIPRTAAEWLAKQSHKVLGFDRPVPSGSWVIILTPESISIQWAESGDVLAIQRFAECTGNFPPVGRLFPDADATPENAPVRVALKPAFIERFTKGATRTLEREAALRMTQTKTSNPEKPGPVLFEFASFRGLLQPNLLLR